MRFLAVFALLSLVGCSGLVAVNDKTEGFVPRSFVVEGRPPQQSSDEIAEYLVRRYRDEHATVRMIPYTAALVAKMEREMSGAVDMALPPKDRCVYVEVVTQESETSQLETLGTTLVLNGGRRVPLKVLEDSRQRNERNDYALTGRTTPVTDEYRPLRAREAALHELESKELRCAEEALPLENGFAVEVVRAYDPNLGKRWLRWSVNRPWLNPATKPREAATVEPLGVVKRSNIR